MNGKTELGWPAVYPIPNLLDCISIGREIMLIRYHTLGVFLAKNESQCLIGFEPVMRVGDDFCDLLLG